ncbi:DUF4127 family protein [Kouleothrix sp.]|uniref:DUF4127 family protein n=1 Tax=Kouleothrix sp. TaxID=2779161 RepID=UPI00391AB68E
MRIGLLPLDERPVNTRYPAMIAAIAGAQLALPPAHLLSARRRPASCEGLIAWLGQAAPQLDALIVSCEMLGYGGLIAARTSAEPLAAIVARLDTLRDIRRACPRLPILGFNVITRVSNADDSVEEPEYWAEHGTRLYLLSQLLDRHAQGQAVEAELARIEAAVPARLRHDFLGRRLRNHAANLAALQLLADGALDLLVLSSDDTSPFGLPSREKRWLAEWARQLGFAAGAEALPAPTAAYRGAAQLLMYPGADEVGCALLARLLNARSGAAPRVVASYAPPAGAAQVAAYEDGPVGVTVERQIRAIGGTLAGDSGDASDIWLGVNAPLARRGEWLPELAAAERAERWPALQALVAEARQRLARGQPVAIADVAYPNGADPALIEIMLGEIELPALAAYGAWNTAGNSIGAALAQASAARLIDGTVGRAAHELFLLHRLLEDWGYQQLARAEVRTWLRAAHGLAEPGPALQSETRTRVERRLAELIEQLPGFAGRYGIVPGSVQLPWGRTFEIDFALERR